MDDQKIIEMLLAQYRIRRKEQSKSIEAQQVALESARIEYQAYKATGGIDLPDVEGEKDLLIVERDELAELEAKIASLAAYLEKFNEEQTLAELDLSVQAYPGPERRQERNADLRAELDELGKKVSEHPELTEDDMSHLNKLIRDYYLRFLGSRSADLIGLVREEHADEFSPAMLALLENVLGLG